MDRQAVSTPRPPDKDAAVVLKSRNVDEARNTNNHVTPSIPAGDSHLQPALHSAVQPSNSTSSSSFSAGRTYLSLVCNVVICIHCHPESMCHISD